MRLAKSILLDSGNGHVNVRVMVVALFVYVFYQYLISRKPSSLNEDTGIHYSIQSYLFCMKYYYCHCEDNKLLELQARCLACTSVFFSYFQTIVTLSRKNPPIGCIVSMAIDRGVYIYNMTCVARDLTGCRKERVLQFRPPCEVRTWDLGSRYRELTHAANYSA